MDCNLSGSSNHGIFQARMLEWVAISFSRGSSWPRDRTRVSCIAGRHFTIWDTRKPKIYMSMDHTTHGILQATTLEWVAYSFSSRSSQPRDQTQVACIADRFFTTEPPGNPSWHSSGRERWIHSHPFSIKGSTATPILGINWPSQLPCEMDLFSFFVYLISKNSDIIHIL